MRAQEVCLERFETLWLGSKCGKCQTAVSNCIDLNQLLHLEHVLTFGLFEAIKRDSIEQQLNNPRARTQACGWDPSAESGKTAVSNCIDLVQLVESTHLIMR